MLFNLHEKFNVNISYCAWQTYNVAQIHQPKDKKIYTATSFINIEYITKKLLLFELAQPTHTMTCHIYCVWHVAVLLNQSPMCASLYPFGYEIPLARMLSPYLTANNSTCNIYTFWECDVCHINIVALLSHTHTHAIK